MEKPLPAADGSYWRPLNSTVQVDRRQPELHHPAFVRLQRSIVPDDLLAELRRLHLQRSAAEGKQFGHWMFTARVNSCSSRRCIRCRRSPALAADRRRRPTGPAMQIALGVAFHASLTRRCLHELPDSCVSRWRQEFPFWQITVVMRRRCCSSADILANREVSYRRTRWLDAVDGWIRTRTAARIFAESCRNAAEYAAATLRITGRNDPFFQMNRASRHFTRHWMPCSRRSMAVRHHAGAGLRAHRCRRFSRRPSLAPAVRYPPRPNRLRRCHSGGTGFIGTHVVQRFVAQGARVSVMARSIRNLPAIFHDAAEHGMPATPGFRRGCRRDRHRHRSSSIWPMAAAVAHGTRFGTPWWAALKRLPRPASRRRCGGLRIGSIASRISADCLSQSPVTTPTDPQAGERADYARAKAMSDQRLLALHAGDGLPVASCGPVWWWRGGTAVSSGLGFFNNDQHCIGWNRARSIAVRPGGRCCGCNRAGVRANGIDGRCYNWWRRAAPRDYIVPSARRCSGR